MHYLGDSKLAKGAINLTIDGIRSRTVNNLTA